MWIIAQCIGVALLLTSGSEAVTPAPILFIIQSQSGDYHTEMAQQTRDNIVEQWKKLLPPNSMAPPEIILTSDLDGALKNSAWTIFPLIETIRDKIWLQKVDWVGILNENTHLDLAALGRFAKQKAEGQYDPEKENHFFGRALRDSEPSIVHHFDNFDEHKIYFPDTESGIFLSRRLIFSVYDHLKRTNNEYVRSNNFNIDPAYEFAKYLLKELEVPLTMIPELCAKDPKKTGEWCITYPRREYSCLKNKDVDGVKAQLKNMLFTVKTCDLFHKERIPPLQSTWGKLIPNIKYFSDKEDSSIPTQVLPYTINTEAGHCNKTRAILSHYLDETDYPWLIIVDDDTILSPARMAQMVSCYNEETGPVILGQRYGYNAAAGTGYNYITGGGGMILNRIAVEMLLDMKGGCDCPAPETPDDMHIGMCAKAAGIDLIHSTRMYQARPPDYPSGMLNYRKPVSFHKHWNIDPKEVYNEWFRKSAKILEKGDHDEL